MRRVFLVILFFFGKKVNPTNLKDVYPEQNIITERKEKRFPG